MQFPVKGILGINQDIGEVCGRKDKEGHAIEAFEMAPLM